MNSACRSASVGARYACSAVLFLASTLAAQVPPSRLVDSVVAQAAAELTKEMSSLPGKRYVRASVLCNAGPVQFVCDLDHPVPSARKRELDAVFALALGPSVDRAADLESLLSARVVARARADADAQRKPVAGPPEPSALVSRETARADYERGCGFSDDWSIIAELLQVSVRADSVLMNLSVTHMGPLAGCAGGSQIWRLIALRRGDEFAIGSLKRGGHFSLTFEVPNEND